jgi:hypothetical protein
MTGRPPAFEPRRRRAAPAPAKSGATRPQPGGLPTAVRFNRALRSGFFFSSAIGEAPLLLRAAVVTSRRFRGAGRYRRASRGVKATSPRARERRARDPRVGGSVGDDPRRASSAHRAAATWTRRGDRRRGGGALRRGLRATDRRARHRAAHEGRDRHRDLPPQRAPCVAAASPSRGCPASCSTPAAPAAARCRPSTSAPSRPSWWRACGVAVAKHGLRAVTSRTGSADVVEALGVRIDAPRSVVARCLREVGITFLYAPSFHVALANAGVVRQELGLSHHLRPLGPLANPAGATHQLLGVHSPGISARWPRCSRGWARAGRGCSTAPAASTR